MLQVVDLASLTKIGYFSEKVLHPIIRISTSLRGETRLL